MHNSLQTGLKAQEYGAFSGNKIEYISGDYVYKELNDETVEITEYHGNDAELTIPSELGEKKVSGIGYNVFEKLDTLTSVTIPDGVATIKGSAFVGCPNLKVHLSRKVLQRSVTMHLVMYMTSPICLS